MPCTNFKWFLFFMSETQGDFSNTQCKNLIDIQEVEPTKLLMGPQ